MQTRTPVSIVLIVDPCYVDSYLTHSYLESFSCDDSQSHQLDSLFGHELRPIFNYFLRSYLDMTSFEPIDFRFFMRFEDEMICVINMSHDDVIKFVNYTTQYTQST